MKKRSAPPGGQGAEGLADLKKSLAPPAQNSKLSRRRQPGRWQYLYDGRSLLAVVEARADGWHVLMHGRDDASATFPTREMAISFANARSANAPAAAIIGERVADAKRVNRIKMHQRAAEAQRARRIAHSQPRQRGRMTGSKEKLLPAGNKPEGTGSRVTTGQNGGRQP